MNGASGFQEVLSFPPRPPTWRFLQKQWYQFVSILKQISPTVSSFQKCLMQSQIWRLVGGFFIFTVFLSPCISDRLFAADVTSPIPPLGLRTDTAPVFNCPASTMVQLPLNWPVDPKKQIGWITPKKQEGYQLCWAATTEMVVNYYGRKLPQCQQVDDAFFSGKTTCCPNIVSGNCDGTRWDLPDLSRYDLHFVSGLITDWDQIKIYICERRTPFLYFYRPVGNEHVILVYGYDTSVNHVFIVDSLDPDFGPVIDAYDFDDMFNGGEHHTRDFLDLCPKGVAAANGGSCP